MARVQTERPAARLGTIGTVAADEIVPDPERPDEVDEAPLPPTDEVEVPTPVEDPVVTEPPVEDDDVDDVEGFGSSWS